MKSKIALPTIVLALAFLAILPSAWNNDLLAQGFPAPPTTSYPNGAYARPDSPVIDALLAEYPNAQEDRKKQIVEQVNNQVKQEFNRRHMAYQQEIQAFEAELNRKKKVFDKREANKDKIIADRVAMLLQRADGTGWEPPFDSIQPGGMIPEWVPYLPPAGGTLTPPNPTLPAIHAPNSFIPPLSEPSTSGLPPSTFPPAPPTQDPNYPKARVSYEDFKELVADVESHRKSRILSLDQFIEMSKQPNVIILDTRSDFRYERIHIKGAKHLSFTDFTQANLANVIPSADTTILIYCNNNFDGNQIDFASKSAPPRKQGNRALGLQIAAQEKPVQLALNVPTYINLYGYGYQNVYELGELVKVTDPRIQFEGSIVETAK